MTLPTTRAVEPELEYPEDDGLPMSDHTLQFRWIMILQCNLDSMFADDPAVFVAGDLLWYPAEGFPGIRMAPEVMVVFGAPKKDRGSYLQWREGGIGPQIVFEIQSPGNRPEDLQRKLEFYDLHGVEEYYLYDPHSLQLSGWQRLKGEFKPIEEMDGWISPRLGIRFDISGDDLAIYRPTGERFLTFTELQQQEDRTREQLQVERLAKEQAQRRAEQSNRNAAEAQQKAEQARQKAEQAEAQAKAERTAKEEALRAAQRLGERLRALGIDPDQ